MCAFVCFLFFFIFLLILVCFLVFRFHMFSKERELGGLNGWRGKKDLVGVAVGKLWLAYWMKKYFQKHIKTHNFQWTIVIFYLTKSLMFIYILIFERILLLPRLTSSFLYLRMASSGFQVQDLSMPAPSHVLLLKGCLESQKSYS